MPDDCITIALDLPDVQVIREKETEQEIIVGTTSSFARFGGKFHFTIFSKNDK